MILKNLSRRGRLLVWIATVALIFLTVSLSVWGIFSLVISPETQDGTIFYKHGEGTKKDRTYEVERALYYPKGVPYINFASMATACGFSVSGDENEIRYIIKTSPEDYDTVTFYYGSREVFVNGSHYMLDNPVRKSGSALLVPAEFVTACMRGATVETTKSKITLVYTPGKISLKPELDPLPPIVP